MNSFLVELLKAIAAFFLGRFNGKQSETEKAAKRAVDAYRKGEEIDAQPPASADKLRDFFNRVR